MKNIAGKREQMTFYTSRRADLEREAEKEGHNQPGKTVRRIVENYLDKKEATLDVSRCAAAISDLRSSIKGLEQQNTFTLSALLGFLNLFSELYALQTQDVRGPNGEVELSEEVEAYKAQVFGDLKLLSAVSSEVEYENNSKAQVEKAFRELLSGKPATEVTDCIPELREERIRLSVGEGTEGFVE